jgi:isoleucyl-tRNA synthetase
LDELNVERISFVAAAEELATYQAKPNYRALGPRFGKRMPQVAAAVAALDPAEVAATLENGGAIGISVDGDEHRLESEDVTLVMQPRDGYEVEAEAGHAVALRLELDDDLRREGLAREIVHAVQNARRSAGLEVSDRIELRLGGDEELIAAAQAHQEEVAGETLAVAMAYDCPVGGESVRIDGRELAISVRKKEAP